MKGRNINETNGMPRERIAAQTNISRASVYRILAVTRLAKEPPASAASPPPADPAATPRLPAFRLVQAKRDRRAPADPLFDQAQRPCSHRRRRCMDPWLLLAVEADRLGLGRAAGQRCSRDVPTERLRERE